MRFGAGRGRGGTVAVLTFGTGIGSALFVDGILASNTELGHIEFHGGDAEHYVSGKMRNELSLKAWTGRISEYLSHVDFVLGVDLVVFGGGVSKEWDSFAELLDVPVEVVPAQLRNYAGIVGAAVAAHEAFPP
jgi:polyphosphate glucokinase